MTTTGVGVRAALPLGWTIEDANGVEATVVGIVLTDITGTPVAGGGGGGAVTTADGADVALGAKADTLYTGGVGAWSVVALLKGLYAALIAPTPAGTNLIGIVQPATIAPAVLTLTVAANFTTAGNVRVQVDGLSGGDSITFTGSVASGGTPYSLTQIINAGTGASVTSITANGVYQILFAGGLYVTPIKTGSASAPVLTASASQ